MSHYKVLYKSTDTFFYFTVISTLQIALFIRIRRIYLHFLTITAVFNFRVDLQ